MDTRLELTDKQKALVKKLSILFDEMKEENLGIVLQDGYMYFLNKSEVLSIEKEEYDVDEWPTDNDDTWFIHHDEVHLYPCVEDSISIPNDEILTEGDSFYVTLPPSTDEELDELASSRAAEQASLKNRLSFLKERKEIYLDSIKQGFKAEEYTAKIPHMDQEMADCEARLAELENLV